MAWAIEGAGVNGGQVYKGGSVGENGLVAHGRLQRQPRFTHAPRPNNGQQTAGRVGQPLGDLRQFRIPADKRGGGRGQR
jgi:hypothetical protein